MGKKIPSILKEIRNFKPVAINYAINKSISYSQIQTYYSCPLKWSLLYVKGIKVSTQNIHTIFGTALHKTLQHYLNVMYETSGANANRENLYEYFENSLREEYKIQYKNNKNQHISTPEELREFFGDGIEIIEFFLKKRNRYFSKRKWHLVGCEVPIVITPNNNHKRIIYRGFIDVVMYHEPTQTFRLIDLKSSSWGWNDKTKKDESKQFQLILYKKYFSEMFNVPLDKIEIEFFILKRKLWKNSEYVLSRIQSYTPPSGKIKIRKALESVNQFIEEVFTKEGEYKDKIFLPNPSNLCQYCPFDKEPKLCDKKLK